MPALTETGSIALFTTVISGITAIVVAWLANRQRLDRAEAKARHEAAVVERAEVAAKAEEVSKKTDEVVEKVSPTNGHDSLGAQLDEIEAEIKRVNERLVEGEQRFDSLEKFHVRADARTEETLDQINDLRANQRMVSEALVKHLDEWDPLLDWTRKASGQSVKKKKGGGKSG